MHAFPRFWQRRRFGVLMAVLLLAGCAAPRALPPTVLSDGMVRPFELTTPPQAETGYRLPLIVVLHRADRPVGDIRRIGRFDLAAVERGFYVAYPTARDRNWNDRASERDMPASLQRFGPDDTAYVADVIEVAVRDRSVDPDRVYVVGMGDGGRMALRMACEYPELIRGAAAVAASMHWILHDNCKPRQPVPVLLMHGTADPLVPFDGGRPDWQDMDKEAHYAPVLGAAQSWARHNACRREPRKRALPDVNIADSVSTEIYFWDRCAPGGSVLLYVFRGGGHAWPGGPALGPEDVLGAVPRDVDATTEIIAFFERQG